MDTFRLKCVPAHMCVDPIIAKGSESSLHCPSSAGAGHCLLDRSEPVLSLGKPGGLLCHHVHHVQQWHVSHLHRLLPLHR